MVGWGRVSRSRVELCRVKHVLERPSRPVKARRRADALSDAVKVSPVVSRRFLVIIIINDERIITMKCIIVECENTISPRSKLDICPTCRSSLYAWRKRRPAEVLHRRSNLTKYSCRMDTIIDGNKPTRKVRK